MMKKKTALFQFFYTVSVIGSLPVYLLFLILLWLFDPSWFFLSMAFMLLLTTVVVYLIKWLYPTPRPDHGHRRHKYFWQKVDMSSFPSAHAARGAGLFTISLFYEFSWLWFATLVFFFLTINARVYLKRHYWKDIIGGLIVGVLLGVASFFLAKFVSSIPWLGWLFGIARACAGV